MAEGHLIFQGLYYVYVCCQFEFFHKRTNIGIIVKFLFPCICKFLLYLHHMILVNVKLDVSGYKRIIFQGCRFHWCMYCILHSSFSQTHIIGNIGIIENFFIPSYLPFPSLFGPYSVSRCQIRNQLEKMGKF